MEKCVEVIDTLILPYVGYGHITWGNTSNAYLNKILVLQKRMLRLFYFAYSFALILFCLFYYAIPLFLKAQILPVTFLYYEVASKINV